MLGKGGDHAPPPPLNFYCQSGLLVIECISQFHRDQDFNLAVKYLTVTTVFAMITLVFASLANMLFSIKTAMEQSGNFLYANMIQIWIIVYGYRLFLEGKKTLAGDVSCSCFYATIPNPTLK